MRLRPWLIFPLAAILALCVYRVQITLEDASASVPGPAPVAVEVRAAPAPEPKPARPAGHELLKVNGQVVGSPTAAYYWPTATIREFVAILYSHKYVNGGICLLITAGAILQHV